ncbi:MAG: DUF2062 domain-containing protein [Akkermansiaceae bacterium]
MVRRAFRALRHPKLRHRPWWKKNSKPLFARALWVPCRDSVASGLAIGLFFSMMLMPFQMIPAALIAMRARSNVPFAVIGCWITNPFTTPAVLIAQFQLGEWMRETFPVPTPAFLDLKATSFIIGMITTGVVLALLAYPIVHLFSLLLPQHLPVRRPLLKKAGVPAVERDVP